MSQIKILDELIKKIISEEKKYFTPDGTVRTATSAQKQDMKRLRPGQTASIEKAGATVTEDQEDIENKDAVNMKQTKQEDLSSQTQSPKATDLIQELNSIIEQLSAIAESNLDEKYKKQTAKVSKYLETAKGYLDNIEEYQKVIDSKNVELDNKKASKTAKVLEKSLSKLIKDEAVVSKIMKKIPTNKIVELKTAYKKDLDEQKLAKTLLKLSLKEGIVQDTEGILLEADASKRVASSKMDALMAKMDKIKAGATEKKETISPEDEKEFIRKSERGLSQEEKAVIVKKRKEEKSYLTDQEYADLSPSQKTELVKSRKKELDPNLSDKQKLLPYEEKLKAISDKGKYDKEYSEEELDKEQDEKIKKGLRKNRHVAIMQNINPDFYLAKKPYYKWDDRDIQTYNKIIEKHSDTIDKKLKELNKDISKQTQTAKSLSSILSEKDAEILANVVKQSYTGGKIDSAELSKAKELTKEIRGYISQNYFTKVKDPSKVGGSSETLNPFDDEIRQYLRSSNIKDKELEAYLGAYLDTISIDESEIHKETYKDVFAYLEFLISLLYANADLGLDSENLDQKDPDKYKNLSKEEREKREAADERDKKISDLVKNKIKDVVKTAAATNKNIDDYLASKIESLMKKTKDIGYDNTNVVNRLKKVAPFTLSKASASAGKASLATALINKHIEKLELRELIAKYDGAGLGNDEIAKKLLDIAKKRKLEKEKNKK
jgi:hypothetical protein